MSDSLSPIYAGDLSTWTLNQVNRDGSERSLVGISTGAITIKLQEIDNPTNVITGAGTVTIPNASAGELTYAPASADVATPGTYWLWVIIQWTSGKPQHSDPYTLEIKAAP